MMRQPAPEVKEPAMKQHILSATTLPTTNAPVRVHVDHDSTRRLGRWTTSRSFAVRARRGVAVLDLRSPEIPAGDIEVRVDLDHALLKLLVPDGARVERRDLRHTGRGRVKDWQGTGATDGGRVIRIAGAAHDSEIRVHRGGIALLSAMFTREYFDDARRAHRDGTMPTVDDPTRDPTREVTR
jgi:hypothetical protein